jgi:hypothetical protein
MNDETGEGQVCKLRRMALPRGCETTLNNVLAPFDMKVNKEGPNQLQAKRLRILPLGSKRRLERTGPHSLAIPR